MDRKAFIELIPQTESALEIGPFFRPLVRGPKVAYFDVLDQSDLRARAAELGADADAVPFIDHVSPTGDLSVIGTTFANVLSSHCIEHQPDLTTHLQAVGRLLRTGGRYFLIIPDKRFCFDALIAETTIAEVLDAHQERRARHRLRSVIEHRALTTHNDPVRHWAGDHGEVRSTLGVRTEAALAEFNAAAGRYIDVHASYFTPDSFAGVIETLHAMKLIPCWLEALYPTRRDRDEFWAVLRKE